MILKKKRDDGSYIQVKINENATWSEASDEFVHFLQGCGYIVQGIEIAEYLMEQYDFQREETEKKRKK